MITSSRLSLSHSEMTSTDCWSTLLVSNWTELRPTSASSLYSNSLNWDFWDTSALADRAGVSAKESEEDVVGLSTSPDCSSFTAERFGSGCSTAGALAFLFPRSRPASEGLLNADSGVLCSFVDVPLWGWGVIPTSSLARFNQ